MARQVALKGAEYAHQTGAYIQDFPEEARSESDMRMSEMDKYKMTYTRWSSQARGLGKISPWRI